MSKQAGLADHRTSIVLDAMGTAAIVVYVAMSFHGPVSTWVQMLYLAGCVAGGTATALRRNYVSLACFAVMALITLHQLASVAQASS